VPIIVAINKCDVQGADPSRVKQQLLEHGLIPEEYGGQIVTCEVSAKTGDGVEDLLDNVLLVAEILELQGNPRLVPEGTVIEAHLEKGRGPVATILVRDGSLKQGDSLVVGASYGRVRTMTDHEGNTLKSAGPSSPVEVIGLNEVPQVGEAIEVAKNERRARKLAEDNATELAEQAAKPAEPMATLEDFFAQVQAGEVDHLKVVQADSRLRRGDPTSQGLQDQHVAVDLVTPRSARSTRPISTWPSRPTA